MTSISLKEARAQLKRTLSGRIDEEPKYKPKYNSSGLSAELLELKKEVDDILRGIERSRMQVKQNEANTRVSKKKESALEKARKQLKQTLSGERV